MNEQRNILTFYTLLITQTVSLIGSRMTALAFGIYLFNTTGDATPLTLVAFFGFLPRLLTMGIGGVLADRWDRRYVMALSDGAQALGTLALLVSVASGGFQIWHLYAVTLFQATFDMLQSPAFQASVTMLVPDKHRNRANAIQMLSAPVSGILAPALTAGVYSVVGLNGIILLDLATFVLGVIVVLLVRIPQPPRSEEGQAARGSILRESLTGFRFVWARKPLLMIFVYTGLTNFFYAALITLNTPYLLLRTGSEAALGFALSAASAGALTGSLLMATWGGFKRRVDTMMPGIAITGLLYAFAGTQRDVLPIAAALFAATMFPTISNVSIISVLQVKVPPDMQGRVFAAIQQISMTLIPLSYLVAGPLADQVFEPLVSTAASSAFAPLTGTGTGAGLGLMYVIGGLAITAVCVTIYAIPFVRQLETLLPDYGVTPQEAGD
jgi:MFS transporter, DHA3 family, macrolide efflux protein